MTVADLVGVSGQPVVFEGAQAGQFISLLEQQPCYSEDVAWLRLARRIIGTPGAPAHSTPPGQVFGYACGRTWSCQF